MDSFSEESDSDESPWSFTYEALNRPTRQSTPSSSDSEPETQECPSDTHESDCPFCPSFSYTVGLYSPFSDLSRAEVLRSVFHEECQYCSSPDGAQIPLCDFCKHLRLRHILQCVVKQKLRIGFSIPLDPKARALSRTKCELCDFLTNAMSLPQTGPSEVEIVVATSATLVIDYSWPKTEIKGLRGSPTPKFSTRLRLDDHQASSKEFVQWDIARRWLLECKGSHNRLCAIRSRPTFPPGFRVIDVSKRCIVERKDFCEYMALSYVWGNHSDSAYYVEQATRDNIESLKVPGGLTQLPETIEDAIAMCQKLGIKYLWVDRYCIVQDHAVHKHTQVAAMADIYSFATLTVIACSGTDGVESGIPGVRRKRQWKRCINIQGLALSFELPHLDKIIWKSMWNTRGWTYQEALLSERKLIMTPTEVWFQCGSYTFREYDSYGQRTEWQAKLRGTIGFDEELSFFGDYASHVLLYTRRKLTYASDIYNAFDGIAQALYSQDDGFHFGLPEPNFYQALLWYCGCRWNDSRSRCLRVCAETTPSWSWGSVTCPVTFDNSFCMSLVKWVLYKAQVPNMSSQSANLETYGTHSIELKATREPLNWELWRLEPKELCPQLFVALAINEGCIKTGKISIPDHESFSSLKAHFTRRWPTYMDVDSEVREIDTGQSSGPNGVLFTTAQSAFFRIQSRWIQNANGMVIGAVCQKKLPRMIDDNNPTMYEEDIESEEAIESDDDIKDEEDSEYEECSNCQECCDDEECLVEGIALSVSAIDEDEDVMELNNPDFEFGRSGWKDQYRELIRDLTYFDCNDEPLDPIPKVNIMFISWEDGYARRIGLGWIVLKQWSSFDWELKDIWLK